MYFVPEGYTVQNGLVNGCLVISGPASSPNGPAPAGLMWPNYTNENPASCSADDSNWAAYTNSYPLEYSSLNALVAANGAPNPGCATWGEPALMAAAAPRGHSGEWLYLAAECLTFAPGTANYVGTTGYFVFYTPIGSDGSVSGTWAAYPPAADDLGAMNFTICAVPGQPYGCGSTAMYFLDELDWAVRADGSMVAVAVPDEVPTNGQPTQGPCLAMTFDLYQPYDNPTGSPFTALVAQVYDQDTLTPSNLLYSAEESSPNGCTYEPQSNTGIPIVRHLVATQSGVQPTQYQTYSIVNSGVMP
jgi:hypothetical protein